MDTSTAAGTTGGAGSGLWASLPEPTQVDERTWRTEQHLFSEGLLIREGVFRVDGGELMAHAMLVAEARHPGRRVVAMNTLFAREGRHEHPTDYEVADLHAGRNFASLTVTATQPGRGPIAHSQVTLAGPITGPDHQGLTPAEVDWEEAVPDMGELLLTPILVAGGRPLGDPSAGPPEARARVPLPASLADAAAVRRYLAFATDHVAIAPALRPHAGIGYRTKRRFYTAPTGLQLRYWGEPRPGDELVFEMVSPVMASGLGSTITHGYDADGRLVFSCGMDVVARAAD